MTQDVSPVLRNERIGHEHLAATVRALDAFVDQLPRLERWGRHLAVALKCGGRVLVVGNGGSAALAQHFTSELVGRYRDERSPLSAIALHAESSALTAIVNDYGRDEMYARQVRAHGRAGDVLLTMSTSGKSANILTAVSAARDCAMETWAMTGGIGNPLERACDSAVVVRSTNTATIQEVHQVAVHVVCEVLDEEIRALEGVR